MKLSICGFNQKWLVVLRYTSVDAVLLRHLIDGMFSHPVKNIKGRNLHLANYEKIIRDLPLLNLDNKMLRSLFRKYERTGLVEIETGSSTESLLYFRFTKWMDVLVNSKYTFKNTEHVETNRGVVFVNRKEEGGFEEIEKCNRYRTAQEIEYDKINPSISSRLRPLVERFYPEGTETGFFSGKKTEEDEKRIKAGIIEIDKVIRLDRCPLEKVEKVLNWFFEKPNTYFWKINIRSPAQLRKICKNGESKFKCLYRDYVSLGMEGDVGRVEMNAVQKKIEKSISEVFVLITKGKETDFSELAVNVTKVYDAFPASIKQGCISKMELTGMFLQELKKACGNFTDVGKPFVYKTWNRFVYKIFSDNGKMRVYKDDVVKLVLKG